MIKEIFSLSITFACSILAMAADFKVADFGAKGDGIAKDTIAIQGAIDAAETAGGGRVVLGKGIFLSGSIFLKDNVELHLEEGAKLLGSPNPDDYNKVDVCPQNWASSRDNTHGGHLVLAFNKKNVSITGKGTIDGNVSAFFAGEFEYGTWPIRKEDIKWRPGQMLFFAECEGVTIRDIKLRNSPYWTCFIYGCTDVEVIGADVKTMKSPRTYNGDGIDIDCCQRVHIAKCKISTDDDSITLRCDPAKLTTYRTCSDILVEDCDLSSLCNCIRIGVGTGTVVRAKIDNIRMFNSRIGINITGTYSMQPVVGGHFKDIYVSNVTGEVWRSLIYVHPGMWVKDRQVEMTLDNISFENISGIDYEGSVFEWMKAHPPKNIKFNDIHIFNTESNLYWSIPVFN